MIVDGVTKVRIPEDAETVGAMKMRAQQFLDEVRSNYPSETLLVISHGLFCRCMQAVYHHVEIADIVPMKNTETRKLEL
jgi:probable phosphoglycerate mutase